ISVDTFQGIPFLDNHVYMTFQFWVCIIFMATFFIEMSFARSKWRYIRRRWLFFLLSIPVLNIINQFNLNLSPETVYFLRFIPLARGGLAIAIIVGFFAHNRMASVFASYTSILVLVVYFCSLIIFEREQPVNPQIPDYSSALWFSCMVVTTIGCNIAPLTISGKILQIVLSGMGMIMFPLFTVFITSTVIRLRQQRADKITAQTHASDASTSKQPEPAADNTSNAYKPPQS
ncbi:MAG: two pore domain potassium channel family protein, partial [Muribaculaceae bacterium]|nr:two pore domain potassium channel family protein [Muribaculaceae bacterium]